MAIGTITTPAAGHGGKAASAPLRAISAVFLGDGAYPGGGTADFEGSLQALLGEKVTLLAVIANGPCGGYVVRYDRDADKLMVFESDIDSDQPLQESSTANLSGVTFELLCICK
jgi:hypothetical protein